VRWKPPAPGEETLRLSSVLPLAALGMLASFAGPLRAQGYRVDLDARVQGLSYRGWQLDSIPIGSVVTGSGGLLYTPDGIGVTCRAGDSVCTYYAAGAKINALPAVLTADFAVWDFGVKGLRLEGNGRLLTDFKDGPVLNQASQDAQPAWPGAQPELQLTEAYLAYDGEWFSGRGGRMTSISRFGYTGFDGAQLRVAEPKGRVGLTGRFGWALARGALVPWTDASLNPLAEYRLGEREKVWGMDLDWNLPFVRGRVLYERQWVSDSGVTTTSSELVGGDLTLRLHPSVTLAGGLDYDMAWGSVGNVEGALTAILPKRFGNVTLGGRRYRPRFPLWSIWSAFSPVPYNAFYGQVGIYPIPRVQVRGRLESYSYDETGASTALVRVESDGWRYGLGATYRHSANLHATLDYQAGLGAGAQALTIDGGVFWRPLPRLGLRASGAYVERSLELRYADATLWQLGLDADASVYQGLRAFGGAWYVNEERERDVDTAGFDWNQFRFHVGLRYGFGSTVDRPSLPPAILRIPEGGAR
jgi:hypothetical protein